MLQKLVILMQKVEQYKNFPRALSGLKLDANKDDLKCLLITKADSGLNFNQLLYLLGYHKNSMNHSILCHSVPAITCKQYQVNCDGPLSTGRGTTLLLYCY